MPRAPGRPWGAPARPWAPRAGGRRTPRRRSASAPPPALRGERAPSGPAASPGPGTRSLEPERDVHRTPVARRGQRGRPGTRTPMPIESRRAPARERRLEVAAPDRRGPLEPDAAGTEDRSGIAHAARLQMPAELLEIVGHLASRSSRGRPAARAPGRPDGDDGSASAAKRSRNASSRSRRIVSPAAIWWPPKRSSRSPQATSASCRSKREMLRPLPLPMSSSARGRSGTPGRPKRSTTREATMPTTPACQPSAASTSAPSASGSASPVSTWAMRLLEDAAGRAPGAGSLSARARGRAGRPRRRRRSAAGEGRPIASPIRPAALSRGPRTKPRWPALISLPARPAARISARRPGQRLRGQHPESVPDEDAVLAA